MVGFLSQTKSLLIEKDIRIKRRHWISNIFGIILPLAVVYIITQSSPGKDKGSSFMVERLLVLQTFLPTIFIWQFTSTISTIVHEKASKVKETFKIMGMNEYSYFTSLFSTHLLTALPVLFGICYYCINSSSDLVPDGLHFQFIQTMTLFTIGTVTFAFLLSTLFNRAKYATYLAIALFLMPFAVYIVLTMPKSEDNKNYQIISCFHPSIAMLFAIKGSFKFPLDALDQLHYESVRLTPTEGTYYQIIGIFLHIILFIYMDGIMPKEFGTRKSFLFPFHALRHKSPGFVDTGIEIQKLSKNFGRFGRIHALQDVKLSLRSGEVFGLLGDNGAGKTTAINLLTGMCDPSQGTANFFGFDLKEDLSEIHKMTGLCMQESVLIPELTVVEHMHLLLVLKVGYEQLENKFQYNNRLKIYIDNMLRKVMLNEDRMKVASHLSGGMRRKLSLALALLGPNKIIFLDEPTAGMDITTTQSVWKLINESKREKVILLTTQYLKEADELCDNLGILKEGIIIANNTSQNIKNRYGSGYKLIISQQDERPIEHSLSHDINTIMDNCNIQTEKPLISRLNIVYTLPFESLDKYSDIFEMLEQKEILHFDLKYCSLEDAYANLEREYNTENTSNIREAEGASQNARLTDNYCQFNFFMQVSGIFNKRFKNYSRDWKMLLMNLIPLGIVVLSYKLSTFDLDALIEKQSVLRKWVDIGLGWIFKFCLVLGYSFYAGIFMEVPIYERQSRMRYLLNAIGISSVTYWLGNFLIDFLIFLIPAILLTASAHLVPIDLIKDDLFNFSCLLFSFGFCVIWFIYAISFLFKNSSYGFVWIGMFLFYGTKIAPFIGLPLIHYYYGGFVRILDVILTFTPIFALDKGMESYIDVSHVLKDMETQMAGINEGRPLRDRTPRLEFTYPKLINEENIYSAILYLILGGIFWCLVVQLLEYLRIFKYKQLAKRKVKSSPPEEDANEFVNLEKNRVNKVLEANKIVNLEKDRIYKEINDRYQTVDDPVIIRKVSQVYGNGFQGLMNVTFGAENGHIFGLLGPNGAGKSTLFDCLTLGLPRSEGIIKLNGDYIENSNKHSLIQMSICPQTSILWENLTVAEHFMTVGKIKGIPQNIITLQMDNLLRIMGMEVHKSHYARTLSGGTQRKLSSMLAILGGPSLIFMDEPTNGLDSISRHSLHQTLSSIQKTIIYTTHRLYDAEHLCNKIGILVNGQLVCIGSPEALQAKYHSGYRILLYFHPADNDYIQNIVAEEFGNNIRNKEIIVGKLIFTFDPQYNRMSEVFRLFYKLYSERKILDFQVFKGSLEGVFNSVVQRQLNVEKDKTV